MSGKGNQGGTTEETVADATLPQVELPTLIRTVFDEAASRLPPGSREEVASLAEVLCLLSTGDVAAAVVVGGEGGRLAAVAAGAAEELGRHVSLARGESAAASRAARRLVKGVEEGLESAMARAEGAEAALAALRKGAPRAEELGEVIDQLEEVATQTSVAALNASVELSRGEGLDEATLAELSEQIRRLAERTAVVSRRLTGAVDDLRGAWRDASREVESIQRGIAAAASRAQSMAETARDVASSVGSALGALHDIRLPEDAHAAEVAARLVDLEHRFTKELDSLPLGREELPEELSSALDRLQGRLRGFNHDGT